MSVILGGLIALKDQRRKDKKKWKEKEPCFATDFENDVAAIQHQNGDQYISSEDHWNTLSKTSS